MIQRLLTSALGSQPRLQPAAAGAPLVLFTRAEISNAPTTLMHGPEPSSPSPAPKGQPATDLAPTGQRHWPPSARRVLAWVPLAAWLPVVAVLSLAEAEWVRTHLASLNDLRLASGLNGETFNLWMHLVGSLALGLALAAGLRWGAPGQSRVLGPKLLAAAAMLVFLLVLEALQILVPSRGAGFADGLANLTGGGLGYALGLLLTGRGRNAPVGEGA